MGKMQYDHVHMPKRVVHPPRSEVCVSRRGIKNGPALRGS